MEREVHLHWNCSFLLARVGIVYRREGLGISLFYGGHLYKLALQVED
jgi:hypothetical protein